MDKTEAKRNKPTIPCKQEKKIGKKENLRI